MNKVIVPDLHKNIRYITWEEIVGELNQLLQSSSNPPIRLLEHYTEFGYKYIREYSK